MGQCQIPTTLLECDKIVRLDYIVKKVRFYREPEKTDKRNLLKLDHEWMATFFLDFIGLSEYNRHFRHLRLDGLTLNGMNGEEIETMIRNDAKSNKHYKHCAASILFGWHLMRIMKFNTQVKIMTLLEDSDLFLILNNLVVQLRDMHFSTSDSFCQ